MLLQSLKYIRLQGKPKEWIIQGCDGNPVCFGNFNLIVGKNSAGKTQTLGVIREIASLFSYYSDLSEVRYATARYDLTFTKDNDVYEYSLEYENRVVTVETLSINGEKKLDRAENSIYSETKKQFDKLDLADNKVTVCLHNDEEYPYLGKLFTWGFTLKNTAFSNQFEKNYLLDDLSKLDVESPRELKERALLLYTFQRGRKLFGKTFTKRIMDQMEMLGYNIHLIDIIQLPGGYSLCVQDEGMDDDEDGNGYIDQMEMSQGMFRALSFLIHLNYALLNNISVCILIDDLGEGLDFDRSNILIDLMMKGIDKSGLQIFVTTNDRYIMNKFPLKYWSVIERDHKQSLFFNYYNSKENFDEFEFTGLNNFDFFTTNFYAEGFHEAGE